MLTSTDGSECSSQLMTRDLLGFIDLTLVRDLVRVWGFALTLARVVRP